MTGDPPDDVGPVRDGVALPREIQEHLGRRLRSELQVEADRPTFLGESSVPPSLEPLVRRLEAGERGERQGYEAVKRALIRPPLIRDRDPSAK